MHFRLVVRVFGASAVDVTHDSILFYFDFSRVNPQDEAIPQLEEIARDIHLFNHPLDQRVDYTAITAQGPVSTPPMWFHRVPMAIEVVIQLPPQGGRESSDTSGVRWQQACN